MDIATEEFSHLKIVSATIQMLLTGINEDLKDAANNSEIMQLLDSKAAKENMIHQGMVARLYKLLIIQKQINKPMQGTACVAQILQLRRILMCLLLSLIW